MIEVYRLKKLSKSSINIFEYEMMPKAVFLAIGITLASIMLGIIVLLVQVQSLGLLNPTVINNVLLATIISAVILLTTESTYYISLGLLMGS